MFASYNQSALQAKTSIRFKPAMVYGHSQESPSHMTNKYTIFYQHQQKRIIETSSFSKINPAIKQGFNISKQFQNQTMEKINSKLQSTSKFNLTRGTFSTFMDNNKHYASISVLHKEPIGSNLRKTQFKPRKTIQSNQTQTSHNYYTSQSINKQQSVSDSKKTCFSLRSSSLGLLKTSIRQRRQQFAQKNKLQIYENRRSKVSDFELGRGVIRHLLFLGKQRIKQNGGKTQMEEISNQLQLFQKKLCRKFK